VQLNLTTIDVTLNIEIVGFVDESIGTPLYISLGALVAALGAAGVDDPESVVAAPTVSTIDSNINPDVDRGTVITAMGDVSGVVAIQDTRSFVDLIDSSLSLFYAFVGIMLLFGGLMAFVLMFSTISVNVSERSTEFATLKASGMSDRTIGYMVAGENLFLTGLGVIPGLIVGTWVAGLMMSSYNSDMFSFALVINPITYVIAAVAMFIVAALSLIPGIRTIRRLNVGEVMRERAV
jgi:putative ABC transport system permease protein